MGVACPLPEPSPIVRNKMSDKRDADEDAPVSAPKRQSSCCPSCRRKFEYLPEIDSDIEILAMRQPPLPYYPRKTPRKSEDTETKNANDVQINAHLARHHEALKPLLGMFTVGAHRVSDLIERARLTQPLYSFGPMSFRIDPEFLPAGDDHLDLELRLSKLYWRNNDEYADMYLELYYNEPTGVNSNRATPNYVGFLLFISLRVVGKSDE